MNINQAINGMRLQNNFIDNLTLNISENQNNVDKGGEII
jgi:hypothetical protein